MRHGRIALRVATLNNPGEGDALYRRASPLEKQSTGLFFNSPLVELLRKGDFALCGGRPKGAALWKPASL